MGVTPPTNSVPTAKQAQDYFCNVQAVRVIISSLCAQEFNKIRNCWNSQENLGHTKKAHLGTVEVREGKIELLQGELEHFVMHNEETVRQIYID
jgi:hypothetical protein